MRRLFIPALLIAAAWGTTTPALSAEQQAPPVDRDNSFDKFAPTAEGTRTTLDWSYWDRALNWFVLNMGPSLRRSASRPIAYAGTRLTWGHDSRYRLEGNRVAYSALDDAQIGALTQYREDLQRIGSEINIASLPRNEQLAFWLNLHNVAVIEQIALAYPVMKAEKVKPDGFDVTLDEAKFIVVAGVAMSPKDIRTKVVYPNWKDPRVIYGFFRGDIGGPSIMKQSFDAANVAPLLRENAVEFVNALRGVQRRGSTMKVSSIYEEARPFYFQNWDMDLRGHLAQFAEREVTEILAETTSADASVYETDLADLSKGETEPQYLNIDRCIRTWRLEKVCMRNDPKINPAVWRYVQERRTKFDALVREKKIRGTVIIKQIAESEKGAEVE